MISSIERYAAALFGFGFAVTAVTSGITTALVGGGGALAAYGFVALRQRRRLDRLTEERFAESELREERGDARARGPAGRRSRRAA